MFVMPDWMNALRRSLPRCGPSGSGQLDEFHAQLIGIIESSSDAIIGKTLEGIITSWNAGAERLFGYSSAEAIGNKMLLIFPPGRESEELDILARIGRGELIENFETVRVRKDGQHIDVCVTISPIRDSSGRIIGASKVAHNITERKRVAAALMETKGRLELLIEHAPAAIALFDREMRYLVVSRRWLHDYGMTGRELIGASHYEVFPEIPEIWKAVHTRGMKGEIVTCDEDSFTRLDGSVHWLKWDVRPWRAADGHIGGIVIFTEDITEQKVIQDDLRIAATAFDSQEGMVVADHAGVILRVNRAFCEMTGYTSADLIGKPASILEAGVQDAEDCRRAVKSVTSAGYWKGEVWSQRVDGKPLAVSVTLSAVKRPNNPATHYVGVFADVTETKRAEAYIHNLAYYDPLTQLPNRRTVRDKIARITTGNFLPNRIHAVIFLDLDNFKMLNDTRGHDAGDDLLREAARRIQTALRGRDTVARHGGDEFVVVIEDLGADTAAAAVHAAAVGEKLRQVLAESYDIAGRQFHCSASLGITLFDGGTGSVDTILKHADLAMYQAKGAGRNTVRFFDPAMQTAIEARSALEADLRQAVRLDQLRLYYQPQLSASGSVMAAEALLRWVHPERGIVTPGEFIPLAEDTGLILPIGQWVLDAACAQLRLWAAQPLTRALHVAVNISAAQFRLPEFVEIVRETLARTGVDPKLLKLEITESVLIGNMLEAFEKMRALKRLGVSFSLDDFGTGYSSLSYLSRLPLDELKIDKSFVANLPDTRTDAVIAQTIITMATSLGLKVVAEGVETEAQRDFLQRNGCDVHQGYLFSRPLPVGDFERYLGALG